MIFTGNLKSYTVNVVCVDISTRSCQCNVEQQW